MNMLTIFTTCSLGPLKFYSAFIKNSKKDIVETPCCGDKNIICMQHVQVSQEAHSHTGVPSVLTNGVDLHMFIRKQIPASLQRLICVRVMGKRTSDVTVLVKNKNKSLTATFFPCSPTTSITCEQANR